MAGHMTYEESKKKVFKGLILLGVVTLVEVFFSLLGKGYVIPGLERYWLVIGLVGVTLIGLSLYKAYFIIYEFMHLGYEVRGLRMAVLLPTTLLIWAIIAFFQEGDSWGKRREVIEQKDKLEVDETIKIEGMLMPTDTKPLQ